jgi:hypothetical protein
MRQLLRQDQTEQRGLPPAGRWSEGLRGRGPTGSGDVPTPAWIHRFAVGALLVGGLAYADWVLQLVLPVRADLLTSYVSELSARGQPFAATFRLADTLGGTLMVLGALAAGLVARRWWHVWSALAVLGVSNVLEAMSPMRCVITFAAACSPPVKQSLMTTVFNPHAWVSVLQTVSCFFVVIAGTIALRRAGARPDCWRTLAAVGAAALLISLVEGLLTIDLLLSSGDSLLGLVQRAELTLTALCLGLGPAWLILLTRERSRGGAPSRRQVGEPRVVR